MNRGKRERDHVVDRRLFDRHRRRLRHEPLGAARQPAGGAVAPEVVAGLARRQADAVAGGIRALGARAAGPREDQDLAHVDERQRGHTCHDVVHEQREPLRVVDHAALLDPARRDTTGLPRGFRYVQLCEGYEPRRLYKRSRYIAGATALSRKIFLRNVLRLGCGVGGRCWKRRRFGRGLCLCGQFWLSRNVV